MLEEPRDQRLEKCIRNCQEEEDADARSDPVWTKHMLEEPRDQKQGICILGADAASTDPDLQMREDDRI